MKLKSKSEQISNPLPGYDPRFIKVDKSRVSTEIWNLLLDVAVRGINADATPEAAETIRSKLIRTEADNLDDLDDELPMKAKAQFEIRPETLRGDMNDVIERLKRFALQQAGIDLNAGIEVLRKVAQLEVMMADLVKTPGFEKLS